MRTKLRGLLACAGLLGLLATACGGEQPAAKDAAGSVDALADAGGDGGGSDASDASGTDASQGDSGATDATTTDSGATDAAGAGPSCGEALQCTAGCANGDKACRDACVQGAAADAAAKLAAVAACHVDLCGAVTEGAVAELECDFAKCFDKLDACVGFGAGEASCAATSVCAANCVNGDAACKLACLVDAAAAAVEPARKLRTCAQACPPDGEPHARAACVATACAAEISACVDAKPLPCLQISVCLAHCKESLPVKPNACASMCLTLGTDAGRDAVKALATCKDQCKQAVNPVGCWGEKCGAPLQGCYGTGGASTCQAIDNCVAEQCEGVGSAADCQQQCIVKGKPGSQDAFVQYEGCVVKNMDTKEAKTAGCAFPYDLATCLPVIKGQYCGNQSQSCFTDK